MEIKEKNRKCIKIFIIFAFLIEITSILLGISLELSSASTVEAIKSAQTINIDTNRNYIFLTELDYVNNKEWSYSSWSIQKNKNSSGKIITLKVQDEIRSYSKGLGLHAKGQVTYDISPYSNKFERFTAKIGIDASKTTTGDVWYEIFTSLDGENWTSKYKSESIKAGENAQNIDINIKDAKYLRIYIDSNGSNSNDDSVLADARLVTKDFLVSDKLYEKIKSLDYYDNILKESTPEYNYEKNYRLILEREFVNKIGYWTIQDLINSNPKSLNVIDWILSSDKNLEQIIEVGNITDKYQFINSLSDIYNEYNASLKTENGYVYQKMMIGLSAAYSTDEISSALSFSHTKATYDVVERFRLMKKLFDEDKIKEKETFKTYHVELMRMVMQDAVRSDETLWLNGYSKIKNSLYYGTYARYVQPNFTREAYYDVKNKETYDSKYHLTEFGVPYADGKTQRYWMMMENGGICWNLSRLGQSLYKENGIAAVGIYQPEHEAFLYYTVDANGNGVWGSGNNIFGWGKSGTDWYGDNGYRMLFDWANKPFVQQTIDDKKVSNSAGYMLLGQAALNRYQDYQKSLYYNLLANSYSNDNDKLEVYNKSLSFLNINLDTYENIINIYKDNEKSSKEWRDLANKIIEAYTFYPNAMYDLIEVIKPYLKGIDKIDIESSELEALKKASKATNKDVLQDLPAREIANYLLGKSTSTLASFSFDGENAGKIIINEAYNTYDFTINYSVDGGKNYKKTNSHIITLTKEEIDSITASNDIKLTLDGSPTVHTIDILEGVAITNKLVQNDDENRFMGETSNLEYSIDNGKTWINHKEDTDISGDTKVLARYKAHDIYLTGPVKEFIFTANTNSTDSYIKVKNINYVSSGSSETNQDAKNMIDGSSLTTWHTKYNQVENDKSYVISFNKIKYLSSISYDSTTSRGRIKDIEVYVSTDNINWVLAGSANSWANNSERKTLKLKEAQRAKYVKIVALSTYGGSEEENKYVSGTRFNYYEDTTKNTEIIPTIDYSITSLTNKDVIATINIPGEYEIIGQKTYTFTKNGTYTFTYKTDEGNTKTIDAKVTWIDKVAPTAKVRYNKTTPTNFSVTASLYDFSKPNVKVTNVKNDGTYTFTKNGEYKFELQDEAGNVGYVTAKVSWIDNIAPKADVKYENTDRGTVVVRVINPSEKITFAEGNGVYEYNKNGTYEIIFYDKASNMGKVKVVIDWLKENKVIENNTNQNQNNSSNSNIIIKDNNSSSSNNNLFNNNFNNSNQNTDNKNQTNNNQNNNYNNFNNAYEDNNLENSNSTKSKDKMKNILLWNIIITSCILAICLITFKKGN